MQALLQNVPDRYGLPSAIRIEKEDYLCGVQILTLGPTATQTSPWTYPTSADSVKQQHGFDDDTVWLQLQNATREPTDRRLSVSARVWCCWLVCTNSKYLYCVYAWSLNKKRPALSTAFTKICRTTTYATPIARAKGWLETGLKSLSAYQCHSDVQKLQK